MPTAPSLRLGAPLDRTPNSYSPKGRLEPPKECTPRYIIRKYIYCIVINIIYYIFIYIYILSENRSPERGCFLGTYFPPVFPPLKGGVTLCGLPTGVGCFIIELLPPSALRPGICMGYSVLSIWGRWPKPNPLSFCPPHRQMWMEFSVPATWGRCPVKGVDERQRWVGGGRQGLTLWRRGRLSLAPPFDSPPPPCPPIYRHLHLERAGAVMVEGAFSRGRWKS